MRMFKEFVILVALVTENCNSIVFSAQDAGGVGAKEGAIPPAAEILDKMYSAIGGREAIAKIENAHVIVGGSIGYHLYFDRAGRFLVDGGAGARNGFDGGIGWMSFGLGSWYETHRIGLQLLSKGEFNVYLTVFRLEQEYKDFKTIGTREFDQQACFEVNAIDHYGRARLIYFNAWSGLIAGVVNPNPRDNANPQMSMIFRDWQKFGDLLIYTTRSFKMLQADNQVAEYSEKIRKIEFNTVDAATLNAPAEATKFKRNPMAGDLPTAQTIIDAAAKAIGGKNSLKSIHSYKTSATWETPVGTWKTEIAAMLPNKSRSLGSFRDQSDEAGTDGIVGWQRNPNGEYSLYRDDEWNPKKISQETLPFMPVDLEREPVDAATLDRVEFAGEPAFKVWIAQGMVTDLICYFSVGTGRLIGTQTLERETPMRSNVEVQTIYEDWKQVGDATLYTKLTVTPTDPKSTMKISSTISYNDVNPAEFELPDAVKKLVRAQKQADQVPAENPAATQPGP